ncbi:hypothetical protein Ancab_037188 [Ancistrocladus abbreviatus]
MALVVDQQSNFKHFCKICKKGFLCGRALGGHMRAHGIGDESGNIDDEDQASDWEDKLGGCGGGDNAPPNNKRMYALRTNPNRLKNCRVCENCGKEFLSWKSFLEHGKCNSEDAESLVSSPGSEGEDGVAERRNYGGGSWSKRKRSFRAKVGNYNFNCPSSEEEDLANCLMMLSNATANPIVMVADQPEESCASASRDGERRNSINYIAPLASRAHLDKAKGAAKGMFECKACKKVFNSHQALGGHRASHKKVKGCFAARLDHVEDNLADDQDGLANDQDYLARPSSKPTSTQQFDHLTSKRKSKVHECSICHRIFSSGQALGGHKRCHWITSNSSDTSTLVRFQQLHDHMEQVQERPMFSQSDQALDLNFPAPNEDILGLQRERGNQLTLKVPTEFFLQSWGGTIETEAKDDQYHHHHCQDEENEQDGNNMDKKKNNSYHHDSVHNNNINNDNNIDDEADSKVKLAKLSELKDMNMNGNSSSWLQVGIGSSSGVGAKP